MSKVIELNDIDDDGFIDISVKDNGERKYISISSRDSASYCTCFISIDDFRKLSAFVESELKK